MFGRFALSCVEKRLPAQFIGETGLAKKTMLATTTLTRLSTLATENDTGLIPVSNTMYENLIERAARVSENQSEGASVGASVRRGPHIESR